MGSSCCHTSIREGCAAIWVCSEYSSTHFDVKIMLEDIDDRWIHFSKYLASVGRICVVPGQCAADYIDRFYMIFQPFMRPA